MRKATHVNVGQHDLDRPPITGGPNAGDARGKRGEEYGHLALNWMIAPLPQTYSSLMALSW